MKKFVLKHGFKLHRQCAYIGGVALLVFGLSGVLHPLMTWTGPRAESFYPPRAEFSDEHLKALRQVLKKNHIRSASTVKLVPTETGIVAQITQKHDQPRIYFDLETFEEIGDFDENYAIWLARYYTGLKNEAIHKVTFQTEFDEHYSWVNRLLPVYRIDFDTTDKRTAFVYTELGALANLTNQWKMTIQTVFGWLHTWDWLDELENLRVFIIALFLITLLLMVLTGLGMVCFLTARKIRDQERRYHHLIGIFIWLPLLAFTVSGLYHLLQSAYGVNTRGLQLAELNELPDWNGIQDQQTIPVLSNESFSSISLVRFDENKFYYRLAVPKGSQTSKVSREARFAGKPSHQPASYISVHTGEISDLTDEELARFYAKEQLGIEEEAIQSVRPVMHFGPEYDFRNKRLPAWRIEVNTPEHEIVFIDPATGALIDRVTDPQRYETYSFSILHKWNFLGHMIGRDKRDIMIVTSIAIAVIATICGYIILIKQRRRRRTLSQKTRSVTAR